MDEFPDSPDPEPGIPDQPHVKDRSRLAWIILVIFLAAGTAGVGGWLTAARLADSQATTTLPAGSSETTATTSQTTPSPTAATEVTLDTSERVQTLSIARIASLAAPAVVEIRTEIKGTGGPIQPYITEGAGSGVILTGDGYIATNNHVIADAQKITVRLVSGEEFAAVLVGTDSETDLAVLKIAADGLAHATLGDSGKLVVGDLVVAIGNPLGELGGTVTDGIISALDREITLDGEPMNLLQTNAAINPGNSGGGLFDDAGNLVGIVVAKSSGSDVEGLGFAIPINDAKPVLLQLIQFGYVPGRIDLGMTLLDIDTEQKAALYRVSQLGVYVLDVTGDSSAAKAGFARGDCILTVDGTTVKTTAEFKELLENRQAGDRLTVVVLRGRQNATLTWTLQEQGPAA